MNRDGRYIFEGSVMQAIFSSNNIRYQVNCAILLKEFFFMPMYSMETSPLFKYFINHGLDDKDINERRNTVLADYAGKKFSRISIPVVIVKKPYNTESINDERFELAILTDENDQHIYEGTGLSWISKSYVEENKPTIFNLDYEILRLFEIADKVAINSYGKETIGLNELIVAYAECEPDIYNRVVDVMLPGRIEKVEEEKQLKTVEYYTFSLPAELNGFITVMNSEKIEECTILGRDKETEQLITIMMKRTKRNVVMVGEPGVGKTAIAEKFVWMVQNGQVPERLRDAIVLSLDINSIIAGTQYRGTAEARFDALKKFLVENPNCILFVDEIHLLLGAGACKEGELDLANALKPLLARGETRVIGATTRSEYEQYFSRDGALKRRFEVIFVEEPRSSEVVEMLAKQIESLEKYHGVTISRDMVEEVVLKAACFNYQTANPDRSLDLLDKAMTCAESAGRKEVTMEDVLKNFQIYFKKYKKMGKELKRATALHEAAHYLLGKYSPELVEYNPLAVSIYPANHYLGVTVCDTLDDETPSGSYEYFKQKIGALLAGTVAEELYAKISTAGAANDLRKANEIAEDVVTKYSLDFDIGKSNYRVYNYSDTKGKAQSTLDDRIKKVLHDGKEYAKKVLNERHDMLIVLVDALEKNGILTDEQIQKIFKEHGLE